jgi:hypothetical protein
VGRSCGGLLIDDLHRRGVRPRPRIDRVGGTISRASVPRQEAAADAERPTKRVDSVAGKPDSPWRKNKLQLAWNAAVDMIERLLAFLDHLAGDPDHEPNLAMPDVQELRDQSVAMFYSKHAAGDSRDDELEKDLDTEEGCPLEISGESDLASTECIDQRHVGQGDPMSRDGEMNLASTNDIVQRFSWTGSRSDREIDPFPHDEPRHQGFTEPTSSARRDGGRAAQARAGQRARQHHRAYPMAALIVFMRGFLAGFAFGWFV